MADIYACDPCFECFGPIEEWTGGILAAKCFICGDEASHRTISIEVRKEKWR